MPKNPKPVTERECDICGASFMPHDHRSRYCSRDCRLEAKRRAVLGKGKPNHLRYGPQRTCEVCGEMYWPRYKDQRACGRECGQWLKHDHIGATCERLHGQHSELMACASCGDLLERRSGGAIYCKACASTAHYAGTWVRGVKVCEDCGEAIDVYPGSGNKCDACVRSHRLDVSREARRDRRRRYGRNIHKARARKYGCYYEPVDRRVVFERDNWACHICGKPIPWGTAPGTPLSPTIDHVWPMAHGGPHSYENVRAAHMICNSIKGDRVYQGGYEDCVASV